MSEKPSILKGHFTRRTILNNNRAYIEMIEILNVTFGRKRRNELRGEINNPFNSLNSLSCGDTLCVFTTNISRH